MKEDVQPTDVADPKEQGLLARLGTFPDDIATLKELQAYYREKELYENEAAILRQLLEKELSPDERAEALHDLMYTFYRRGDLDEAIHRAEDLLNAYPNYRYLGSVFWLLGVMYANRTALPEHHETWQQDIAAAERNLRRALDHTDDKEDRVGILVELGSTLNIGNKLEEAQGALEQALEDGIEDPHLLISCYQQLGRVLYRLDNVEQAKRYYKQAVLVHPEQLSDFRVAAYVGLASTCREQGDIDQAEQYIQQARCALDELSSDGASVALGSIYEELGDIALQKDEYQRASDHFEAALGQFCLPEKQEELYHKLGVAWWQDGQYERALEYLRRALAIELSLPQTDKEHIGGLLLQMGQCEYGLGHFQQTIVLLEKARETVDPSVLAVLHLGLGHSYYWLKRFDNAAECYKKALRGTRFLSPDWREAMKYFVGTRIAR